MKILYAIKDWDPDYDELHELDYFQNMLDEGIETNETELTLEEFKTKTGTGTFWCEDQGEGYEQGEGVCGTANCSAYKPRNGKSGRCRYHKDPHWPTGKFVTVKKQTPS